MRAFTIIFTLLATICLSALFQQEAKASHAMGADLTYICVGQDSIQITLSFYRDCDGVTAPTSANVTISSASCGINTTLNLSLISSQEVSPLCASFISQSSCNGGTLPGVEQYVYNGIFVLPAQCSDWVIGYSLCCRNALIDNLVNPGSESLYVEATLNNSGGACNNSPIFTSLPVPYLCAGQPFNYNHGAVDLDGDSIAYCLVDPLDGPSVPITHTVPYTATNPMPTQSGFSFNQSTGQMLFVPTVLTPPEEVSVVTILVKEFRNGVQIGSTMRDIQIVVLNNCQNQQPELSNILNLQAPSVLLDSNEVGVCPGDTVRFNFIGSEPDVSDSLFIFDNANLAIPTATLTHTRLSRDSIFSSFMWVPNALDTGVNVFTITLQDNGCPILGTQFYTFNIFVYDETYAGPDRFYCDAGGPQHIHVVGGSQFSWSPTAGIIAATPDSSDIWVAPLVNTTYVVTSDLSGSCKNKDTINVTVTPDFIWSVSPTDTICSGQSTQFDVVTDPVWAPYTFNWTPSDSLSSTTVSNPTASPLLDMTYLVEVTSDTGCTIIDTLNVVVTGEAPQVFISGNTSLCFGDTTVIEALPCNVSVSDDFDPGIDASVWDVNAGTANTNCGSMSGNALQFDGAGIREARTIVMDMSGGGSVTFALKMADGANPCENADINEGVDFEYSTNGTNWTNIFYYDPDVYTTWAVHTWDVNSQIPGAISPTTQFRWIQNQNSGSGFDNWAIDDVEVECCGDICGNFTYQWAPNVGISSTNIASPSFYPTSTQSYQVTVTPAGTDCETIKNVTIQVGPAFTWNSVTPDTICKFGQTQIGVTPDVALGPYSYLWTPSLGLSDSSLANPIAAPSTTTTYYVAMESDSGCITFDSVTVHVSGQAPIVDISTSDNNVCPGDVVQLDAEIFAITCGPAVVGCSAQNPPVLHSVGSGLTTIFGTPFQGTSENGRWQTVYKRTDLAAAGIAPGTMTRLELEIGTKGSTAPFQNLTISLGCVPDSCLSTTIGWLPTTTQVYGPAVYSTVAGWNSFAFSQPYDWDGQSNLVVEICWENPAGSSPGGTDELMAEAQPCISAMRNYTNITPGCNLTPLFTYTMRPNANFYVCPAQNANYSYTWTPVTGLSSDTIINPTATVNYDITYQLFVDDGDCEGADFIDLFVDSSYYAVAVDTFACNGDTVSMGVDIFGDPPSTSLICGANATLCTDTPHTEDIGTGTQFLDGFTYPAPFGNWYWGARHQILYTAADLQANGIQNAGTISEIGFNVAQIIGTSSYTGFTIRMGCTGLSQITTFQSGMTTVVNPHVYNVSAGWNMFTLDQTYDWDGVSNLIVEVCFNNSSFTNNSPTFYTTTPYTSVVWFRQDAAGVCTNSLVTGTGTERPNTRFTICDAPPATVSYQWTPNTNISSDTAQYPQVWPTVTTDYIVQVTYVNGCVHFDTATVDVSHDPTSINNDTVVCIGDPANLWAAGGVAYDWTSTDPSMTCTNCPNPTVTPTTTSDYTVTITDSVGCVHTQSTTVTVNPLPVFDLGSDFIICFGEDTFITAPDNMMNYQWADPADVDCDTCQTVNVAPWVNTTYSVTVTDNNGCMASDTINIDVVSGSVDATANPQTVLEGDISSLFADITGTSDFSVYWTPGSTLNDSTIIDPTATPVTTTLYDVFVIDNIDGCIYHDTITVVVQALHNFVVPTAFTPNGDGDNDIFEVLTVGAVEVVEFNIWNRWGEMISSDLDGWDGNYKGEPQPVGTYVYQVVVDIPNAERISETKSFSLIR